MSAMTFELHLVALCWKQNSSTGKNVTAIHIMQAAQAVRLCFQTEPHMELLIYREIDVKKQTWPGACTG